MAKQKRNAEITHKAQPEGKVKYKETNRALHRVRLGFAEGVQGLREARKRSLLGVNEHFEPEYNAEITRKAQPTKKGEDKQNKQPTECGWVLRREFKAWFCFDTAVYSG